MSNPADNKVYENLSLEDFLRKLAPQAQEVEAKLAAGVPSTPAAPPTPTTKPPGRHERRQKMLQLRKIEKKLAKKGIDYKSMIAKNSSGGSSLMSSISPPK